MMSFTLIDFAMKTTSTLSNETTNVPLFDIALNIVNFIGSMVTILHAQNVSQSIPARCAHVIKKQEDWIKY